MAMNVLTSKQVCARFQISRMTFYRWRKDKGFPPPILQTNNFMRFDADQVIAWYQTQIDKTANLN